jgi:hypothetical protein
MMQVSLEDAYRAACGALGEAMVRETLLTNALNETRRRIAELEGIDNELTRAAFPARGADTAGPNGNTGATPVADPAGGR